MHNRSQLSPIFVTHESRIQSPEELPVASLAHWKDVRFFRCKLVYDSRRETDLRPVLTPRHPQWSAVFGIGLASVVSASIWAGVVWGMARILR
jgi:hypothetical protein